MDLCIIEGVYRRHVVYLIRRLRHPVESRLCRIYIAE